MTSIINLKNKPLKATACGNCQGSSSDNKIRTEAPAAADEQAGTATAAQL